MRSRSFAAVFGMCALAGFFLMARPAFAGPGGEIAESLFATPAGRIVGVVLVIVFSPFLIYISVKEAIAEKQSLEDLRRLATVSAEFDWLALKERVTSAFHRVHAAWRKEDMQEASEWMTDWYWQNQQMLFLDQWERDGLTNHCRVQSVRRIRPLYVRYQNRSRSFDGSRVVVSITAKMEDYLAERESGRIVQGKKGFFSVETVWTFLYDAGRWRVSNIEKGALSLAYAKLVNEVPQVLVPASAHVPTRTPFDLPR